MSPVSNIILTWSPDHHSQGNPRYITSFNTIKVFNVYIIYLFLYVSNIYTYVVTYSDNKFWKNLWKTNIIIVIFVQTYDCMFCANLSWSSDDSSGDYNYDVGFWVLNCIFEWNSWRAFLSLWSDYSYTIPNSV